MALYWTTTSGPAGQQVRVLNDAQQATRMQAQTLDPADLVYPAPGGGTLRVPPGGGAAAPVNGTTPGQLWFWNGSLWLPTASAPSAGGQVPIWNAGAQDYDFAAVPTSSLAAIPANTVIGNPTGAPAVPTAAQVTAAQMADAAPLSVLARSVNSSGPVQFNSAGAGVGVVFRENGGTIGWGVITNLGIANNTILANNIALIASSVAIPIFFGPFALPSGGSPGVPDDVTIYNAALPFGVRIVDCLVYTSVAAVGSTVQLRTAAAGGGSALSSAIPTALTGTNRNNDTATRTVGIGGSIFARRSDSSVQGSVYILTVKI